MRQWPISRLASLCWLSGSASPLSQPQGEHGDWPFPGRDFAGFRYSGLEEINTENVSHLTVAWMFSVGVLRGQEAAPIVAEDRMFVVTPYPNILYALDLTKPGAPLKWKHEPKPLAAAQGVACCDTVNRGATYADRRVFFNTLDGQQSPLDAGTGEELWRTQLGDINIGETMTMAPWSCATRSWLVTAAARWASGAGSRP